MWTWISRLPLSFLPPLVPKKNCLEKWHRQNNPHSCNCQQNQKKCHRSSGWCSSFVIWNDDFYFHSNTLLHRVHCSILWDCKKWNIANISRCNIKAIYSKVIAMQSLTSEWWWRSHDGRRWTRTINVTCMIGCVYLQNYTVWQALSQTTYT